MSSKIKRERYKVSSKFHNKIMAWVLLPSFFTIILAAMLIVLIHNDLINSVLLLEPAAAADFINEWRTLILSFLTLIFIFIVMGAFRVTNQYAGPLERVIREMDEMIETNTTKDLSVRPDDDLAGELVKRINHFIKKSSRS